MTVFVCGEEVEDILCGVYDAWMSRLGHANVRLELPGRSRELFCEYRQVETAEWKTEKVIGVVRRKLSERVYETVYRAALSQEDGRADAVYRFLVDAFRVGPGVLDRLQLPSVYEVFRLVRSVGNEEHRLIEFARFSQMKEGVLVSRIGPKCDVTALVALHFADRMPSENWIIYDCLRRKAAVHQADHGWVMVRADSAEWQEQMSRETDEAEFEDLWRIFHRSIAIGARTNPRCQMNMLPLRFRPYMLEFDAPICEKKIK